MMQHLKILWSEPFERFEKTPRMTEEKRPPSLYYLNPTVPVKLLDVLVLDVIRNKSLYSTCLLPHEGIAID